MAGGTDLQTGMPVFRSAPPAKVVVATGHDGCRSTRYNRTVRQEWLGQFIWKTIEEVKDHATRWLWTYNNERPNMGIGGITPAMSQGQAKPN
jgi:hypothetical protein